jgi:hypothetical protein
MIKSDNEIVELTETLTTDECATKNSERAFDRRQGLAVMLQFLTLAISIAMTYDSVGRRGLQLYFDFGLLITLSVILAICVLLLYPAAIKTPSHRTQPQPPEPRNRNEPTTPERPKSLFSLYMERKSLEEEDRIRELKKKLEG